MAKLVLYLAAGEAQLPQALAAAIEFCSSGFADKYSLHCSLMQPRADDVLAIPQASPFLLNLGLVLEVSSPAGKPLAPLRKLLSDELKPLLSHVNTEHSSLLAVTARVLQNNGSRQQRYHYLMVKAGHFSSSDYLDYYMNSHYRFGIVTPLANYIQNYVDTQSSEEFANQMGLHALHFDNVSELQFDDINEYLSCAAILEAGLAASADEALFVDRQHCQSFSMNVVFDSNVA